MNRTLQDHQLKPHQVREGLKLHHREVALRAARKEYADLHRSGLSWAGVAAAKDVTRAEAHREGKRWEDWAADQSELKALSKRTRSALEKDGLFTRAEVLTASFNELLRTPGLGIACVSEVVLWVRGELTSDAGP
jgi:hypothetical protein